MSTRTFRIVAAAMLGAVLVTNQGCCHKPECVESVAVARTYEPPPPPMNPCGPANTELPALPPNAKPGECYAKAYIPATYRNVTEKVLVREASEKLEIVPAEYEWVEDRVLIKEASTELRAVPAEYAARDHTIETAAAHTDWEVKRAGNCDFPKEQPTKDVFCLVSHPAQSQNFSEQYVLKPATVEEKTIPAEYDIVKRQRLVHAATTRRVAIPAEYAEVTRVVKVCDARMAWQKVACAGPGAMTTAEPTAVPAGEEPKTDATQVAGRMESPSARTISDSKVALRSR